jgi:hypothetical protein
MSRGVCVAVALCLSGMFASCSPGPLKKPVPTSPINTGAGSMSEVRKQLEGRWTLTSFTVSAEDGRQQIIDAMGVLVLDGFGNLQIEYRISDAGRKSLAALGIDPPSPVISTAGRVVIDAQQKRITYAGEDFEEKALGFDPTLAKLRANPFALERIRYYEFGVDDTLRLSTRYENGREAAVGRWKRSF